LTAATAAVRHRQAFQPGGGEAASPGSPKRRSRIATPSSSALAQCRRRRRSSAPHFAT